ncbi:MAG: hypothetical protein A3D35_01980 [Candidatus Staskawiczbacteria bacterium RIFCSPHIGHO2_02_FULL_34_9]|uniref:Small ribosomal subunit protein uS4 n=1 Tax=Candidatus Staskawiczbacteria bacterium RIFCSPHIGHO2_02_FULL_34_9 TaxID=1802206 RepID=A0A1G2I1T9_9BACT|nr:MAG: hypothetical protein A3D35_01980 [Candidatus Staskawiczbacteria bacterium RIFCSPHIGHO2_02_FULL_34_9]
MIHEKMAETNTNTKNTSVAEKGFPNSPAPRDQQRRGRRDSGSGYKKSLQEKQSLKRLYNLSEKQFKKYVTQSLLKRHKVENVSDELIRRLEKRLDNVIFRLGFAKTRKQARQMVSHAYFKVNGRPVNIASFEVERDDVVEIKETKKKKLIFKDLHDEIKKIQTPNWLNLNKDNLQAKVSGEPTLAEVNPPVEISLIFEFYSR